MSNTRGEAFSRVLIDEALKSSGWDLLDASQVTFEAGSRQGRVDYLLKDRLGRVLCVLEAKRPDADPYDAKEQARGYAENLNAPLVLLSNGREHWFWNYTTAHLRDAYRIERMPSQKDLERVRQRNLQPARPLQTEEVGRRYLDSLLHDVELREYQVRALETIAEQYDLQGRRKFLLEMATGTGKTLLCAALIRRFLRTRNAERVLFIVDRIELARQASEVFASVLGEYQPVIYRDARRSGELLGSSVVIATIQSLTTARRYREQFTPFYFDFVINDEAHRSIYGDAREAVQYFQATRLGLTATPRAFLKNINAERLLSEDPRALEARELRDTYRYFGCESGEPTFRYDLRDALQDPEGPFLCSPRIIDCRSDITTQALGDAGWTVRIDEHEESFKIQDLERTIFTPHRNTVMCETFLREAQRDPSGEIGKSIVFAVNQDHATGLTKTLNRLSPGIALTITSRIPSSASLAKEFRDGKRNERVAVSVDMLSTGYDCRDLLNVVLMRPIFSPSEYIQIKGRGTRRHTFRVGHTEYEKKFFFVLDFCAVAEFFEERYDYDSALKLPAKRSEGHGLRGEGGVPGPDGAAALGERRDIPVWEGIDRIVSKEVRIIGPDGERVDAMSFRGSFERDLKEFRESDPDLDEAVESEDDDAVEIIVQERFYHRPDMYYSTDKLVVSYGVPASTAAFVYSALGKRSLPTREEIVADTVDSIASRFNLRYNEQQWLSATAELIAQDGDALADFLGGRYQRLFERTQFQVLGGLSALTRFDEREQIFEALAQSVLAQASRQTHLMAH
jgi:type I restriction enzyme, R subunit